MDYTAKLSNAVEIIMFPEYKTDDNMPTQAKRNAK